MWLYMIIYVQYSIVYMPKARLCFCWLSIHSLWRKRGFPAASIMARCRCKTAIPHGKLCAGALPSKQVDWGSFLHAHVFKQTSTSTNNWPRREPPTYCIQRLLHVPLGAHHCPPDHMPCAAHLLNAEAFRRSYGHWSADDSTCFLPQPPVFCLFFWAFGDVNSNALLQTCLF